MLSLFRTNQLLAGILFLPYLLLCRISGFVLPQAYEPEPGGIGSFLIFDWIGYDSIWADSLAILVLFIQAIWLSSFVIDSRMMRNITLFPGLVFILICSLFPSFLHLSPLHLANLFLLAAITQLSGTYKKHAVADRIYNTGFWIGVASLFVPAYLMFAIFAMAGLATLRAFSIRERLMVLLGMITPYILLGTYFFVYDQWDFFWQQQTGGLSFLDFSANPEQGWAIKLGIFGALILMVLANYGTYVSKQSILTQKTIQLQYWVLLSGGLSVWVQADTDIPHLLAIGLPAGLLLSLSVGRMRPGPAELVHLGMLLIAAWFQLSGWLLAP